MIKIGNLFVIFYCIGCYLFSNDINTYINPLYPRLGESFSFIIEVNNGKNISNISNNDFLDNFIIINGPNKSTSNQISIINGSYTQISKTTLEWIVSPKSLGAHTIKSANLRIDGKDFYTKPLVVNILSQNKKKYFVESKLTNYNPYRGEQVILSYIFYSRTKNIYDINFELPDYKDFWYEKTIDPKKIVFNEKIKNGQKLYYFKIAELALFPTQSGKLNIEPMVVSIEVPEDRKNRNNDMFGNFFSFNTTKRQTILSEPIELDVMLLPNSFDINSNIGEWDIKSNVNNNKIQQNDALTFEISIKGIGNLDAISLPEIKFPLEFDVFDPEIETTKKKYKEFLGGQKVFKYILIAREEGRFIIPKIEFKFYNTKNKKWDSKSTNTIEIDVVKANIDESYNYIGYKKSEVELIQKDIRFSDLSEPAWIVSDSNMKLNYIIYQLLIVLGLFLFPYIYDYIIKNRTDSIRILNRKLNATISKLDLKEISFDEKCNVFNDSIIDLINYKKNQNFNYYSTIQINSILRENNISEKLIKEVNQIFSKIQEYNFSKKQQVEDDFLLQSKKLIKSINDEWT